MKNNKFSNIERIVQAAKKGGMYILVDDENRENEGDLAFCSSDVTSNKINFMAKYGRGLICLTLNSNQAKRLDLNYMSPINQSRNQTAFTVSIEAKTGVTTGISAKDRARTIKVATKKNATKKEIVSPGHVFPIIAKDGGVLVRAGHTEASVDISKLAKKNNAAVICEIMNEDGTMARLPQLVEVAKRFDLKLVSIEDLVAYRMLHDSLIEKKEDFEIETRFGSYRLRAYKQTTNDQLHLALTKGTWEENEPVLVRVNSTLVNNDILGTLTNNADKKLDDMFKAVNKAGKGAIVFINQESQALNLLNRLSELKARQKEGEVKAPPIQMDQRDFGIGAQILHDLGIHKINLLSNSTQQKRVGMIGYGLEILDYVTY